MASISPTIVQLNQHNVELSIPHIQYYTAVNHIVEPVQPSSHCIYIQLPANISLLNEFMCGSLDIQDIKGETDVEAEHDTGSPPDQLISPDVYEPVVVTTDEHRVAPPTDSINGPRKLTPVYT